MKRFKVVRNERGSLSIEFLGILPFYFLFFLLLWQVVRGLCFTQFEVEHE